MELTKQEIKNPYWDIVKGFPGSEIDKQIYGRWSPDWIYSMLHGGKNRDDLCREYTWAIPSPEALAFVAKYLSPKAVEIGAGTGYWASCLAQMGVDIICYDAQPPHLSTENHWHSSREDTYGKFTGKTRAIFHEVLPGDVQKAAEHPDRTLFLCWPPYDESMAYDCLRAYTGQRLVFIGEGEGGCTGDDKFFVLLDAEWDEIDAFTPVQWSGIHDEIVVYERGPEEATA